MTAQHLHTTVLNLRVTRVVAALEEENENLTLQVCMCLIVLKSILGEGVY